MIRTFQGFTTEDKEFAVLLVLINLHILPESYVNEYTNNFSGRQIQLHKMYFIVECVYIQGSGEWHLLPSHSGNEADYY